MIDDLSDWETGEWPSKPTTAEAPARKARPASARRSLPAATQAAVDDINDRYPGVLNDDLPADL